MHNYAFCFAAEVISPLTFAEIPVQELYDAIRTRLDQALAENNHEVFEEFDDMEEEDETTNQEPACAPIPSLPKNS